MANTNSLPIQCWANQHELLPTRLRSKPNKEMTHCILTSRGTRVLQEAIDPP